MNKHPHKHQQPPEHPAPAAVSISSLPFLFPTRPLLSTNAAEDGKKISDLLITGILYHRSAGRFFVK